MSRTNKNNIVQVLGWLSCALLLAGLLTAPARASNFTWTNTADGTSGYWTNGLLWNPGGPGSYPGSNTTDNAYLTNNTAAGAVYTNILNFSLPTALNTLAISNSTGGTAWLIVTNATLINTTNTIGNGGVLQIDNGGLVSNTTAFNWRGTNGVIYLNSGGQLKTAANVTIGNGISNVTATVSSLSGAGNAGRWDFGGKSLSVGNGAATGIVLTVNAVTLTNLNTLSISGTSGNTLTASNGAQIAASFSILGTSNTFNMGGLGAQSAFTNSGGGFWVGQTGGGYNQLTITNATFYITATSGGIGGSGGGTNTVTILANGSVSNGMTVGNGSPGNRLIVNGGTLNGNVTVGGNAANSYGSSLTVSNGGYLNGGVSVGLYNTANSGYNQFNAGGLGAPSIISMSNPSVGSGNSFNTMTVTNADVYGSQMNLGSATGSSNTVTVLTNGIFRGGGGSFYIGSGGGSSNSFNVIGGIATNWGINSSMYVAVGKGNGSTSVATSNALNISDGGLFNAGFVYVGYTNGDVYNAYNVGGVGAPSSVSNGTLIVGNGGASFSTLTVTNATLLAGGNVTIGSSASNNTASVYNGGTWNLLYKNLTVGSGAATGNVLTVTDGVLTNVGTLAVGVGGGWSNSFTISGAATVSVVKLVVTNDLATGNANQLTFAGGFLTVTNAYITNGVAFTIGNGVTAATLNEVGGFIGVSNGLAVANLGTITGWGTNSSPIQVSNSGNIFAVNGTLLFTNSAGSDATFGNAGTLGAAANSTLRFVGQIGGQLITNFGTINLNGGTLSSGVITNLSAGTVRGAGTLSNLVYNLGTVDATNGTLKFWNNLINANGATLNVRSDGIALITNATASLGVIFTNYSGATVNLRGGTIVDKEFVNQGQLNTYGGLISNALQNAGYWNVVSGVTTATPDLNNLSGGVITNAATLQVGSTGSGPVVNAGTLVLQGGTLLAGSVTNTSSGTFQLAPGGATSTSTVSNGTTFVNQGILSLAGGQTLILSGMTLTNAASGYVVGNGGTLVLNNASFFNQSQQNALWDMGSGSTLLFTNGASYTLTVAGTDNGSTVLSSPSTTNQNYFVSNLSVAGGTLLLTNWAGGPHALYVANLTLAPGASITNASGLTVYYGALNLNGGTTNGAFQIWTSGASPVWVFTNATGVSDWAAGNSWDQGTAPAGGTVQVWVTNAITAATALLYTNATSTITTFTLSNSTSFKHTLILSNGSLAISSPTLVGSNGVIQIGTGSAAATLTNATLTLASGGQIVMTNGQAGPVNKWVVTGALNSTAGSTITMAGASSASNLLLLTTAPFVNNGFLAALSGTNIIQASAVANAGTLAVQGGALLVQPTGGFFLNQAGGTIQITNGSLVVTGTLSNQAGAVLAPLANGTLTISGGALVMNGPYTNRGTTAFLNSLGTFTGNFVNSGAWTASASTNAIAGDLLIGSGAAGTLSAASAAYVTGVLTNFGTLNILSGSVLTNGNAFLAGPATVLVSDAGSVWSNAALNLGTGGTLSSVVVSNGGSFYASSLSFGASNNLFTLGGAGAMSAGTISTITLTNFAGPGVNQLTLSNSLLVHATVNLGNGGVLQIDNGGVASNTGTAFNWTGTNGVIYLNTGGELLTAGNVALGNGISNINATVSSLSPLGSAGVWDLLGKNLTIGTNAAVGNVLNVNAATLANVNKLFIGSSTSSWNSLVISNGASLVVTGAVNVGTSAGSSNNSYFVGGLGAVSFVTNALINVGTTSAGYNTMTVTNANFSSTGNVTIGNNSSNNTVTVLANAFWNLNGQQLYIGSDNNSTGNVLVINGGSVTNLGGGVVLKGVGNSLTVSNGGILWGPDLQMGGTSNTVTYGGAGALSVMSNLTFYVGANLGGLAGGGYDQMTITNATVVTGSGNHGIGAGSSNNTLTVLAGGTYIGGLYVGSGSTGNTLVVNGGTVTPIGQFLVTQNSDGFGNSVTISNGGSFLGGQINIGTYGLGSNTFNAGGLGAPSVVNGYFGLGGRSSFNTVTATNVTIASGNSLTIGITSSSNSVTVLANSLWSLQSVILASSGGTSNTLTINNGTVTNYSNLGNCYIGYGNGGSNAINNALNILNGGVFNLNVGCTMYVGYTNGDMYNVYNVGGVGAPSSVSNGLLIVGNGGASFSTLTVTNANLWTGGNVTIGKDSSNNTATIQAGGYWNTLSKTLTVGSGAATGNTLWVQSGGILEANTLITGGTAANVITNSGGVYQFTTTAPTITSGSAGSIAINGGTISFRAITNADVTSNLGAGNLKNISFSGANTFMLNGSSNTAATVSQTYTFQSVAGNPSNYVNLAMINGATAYGKGDLTIGATGTMLVSNTTARIGGSLTNAGLLTILDSPITFASNFYNQGTVQLGSNSTIIGLLTMNSGTLAILGNAPQTYASNINLQGTGTFDTSGGNLTLQGAVTNSGALVKIGSGVLTLAATNTYTGGTVVQNGTLIMGNALAVSNGTALTVNGGLFDPNGNARIVSTLNGSGGVISNYDLTVAGGGNYRGVIAGPGGLVNTGSVSTVLILSGNNTYSGATTISNGVLQAASSSAISTGAVSVLTGGALQLNGGVTLGNTLTLFDTGVTNSGALRNISGNNSYTGAVTFGSAARINSDANQLTLSNLNNNNFTLTVGGASTTLVAGVISGGGGLVKDGSGVLTLNGTQAFTGATTVSNGLLAVNGSLNDASSVVVLTNGMLSGSASLGSVTIQGGGTIAPGSNGVGTIHAAALTLAANSQVVLDFSTGARSYDQILVTNLDGVAISGGALSLYQVNTATPFDLLGSYKLIQYNGALSPAATNLLSVVDQTQNRLYGFSLSGGWVTLSITSTGGLGWVGSAVDNFWSTSANWAGGRVPQAGDQLVFDGHTGQNNTNDLAAHTQFSGIYFNTTADAFTLNGTAVDLMSDVINLSAHTQTINLPLVLAVSNLVFNTGTGSLVINGAISETNGSFGLIKEGATTLVLAGPNTYTGGTLLDAGTLSVSAISDSSASGISTGGVLTFNGGALQFTGAGTGATTRGITNIGIAYIDVTNSAAQLTLGGVISGGNGLTKLGAGTLVLAGTNTYSGETTINNGTVAISADFNLGAAGGALTLGGGTLEATNNFALDSTRPITLNSPGGTFNVDTNSTLTVGNTINNGTGSAALTKTGAGTLVLSNAANNYSGGTVINAGILALGSDGATNENVGALGSGLVTITGNSQLRLGGGADLSYSIGNGIMLSTGTIYAVAGVQNLTGSLTVNSGGGTLSAQAGTNDLFLTGLVSGNGSLTVYDSGSTTNAGLGLVRFANNNNTYSGTLTISSNENNGVVSVDAANALQFATVNDVSGYGNSLVFYQATAGATNFTLGALGGTANIILQTWTNTAGGDPLVTGSAVTLTVGGNSNNTTYAGALGGSGALVKTGTGSLALSGANTNRGGVTVSSGTLLLSGGDNRLFTNGAVTVAGGTLNLGGFTQTNGNMLTISGGVLTNGTVAKLGADYLGQSGTISATLAGSAGLTKSTTGILAITGSQLYTGTTTVSNGTLVVNGALFGAGLVNVLSNATLTGNATLGNVTVGTGGILSPGNNGIGTFAMATLTTAGGSQLNFDFTATTNDLLYVTANNGLTVTGGVFTLYQAGTTQTFDSLGTYNLIDYVGVIGGLNVTNFTVANTIGNRSYTFGTNNGWVTLTIAGSGVGWLGAHSALWSDPGNWAGNHVPTNGIAVFNGNTQTSTINDLADHAVLAGITFAADASAFSLSGLAPGTNSVNLEGGVSNLSSNVQTINLPLIFEGSGRTRTFNASNGALIVTGVISETNGVFSLVKEGANLLVLAGANTYSGGTVLNAGTLGIGISSIGSAGALGTGTLFIHGGSLVAVNGAQMLNNAVGVVGNFSVGGNQDLTFAGPIDLSNATRTLTVNNTANTFIAGTVSNGALTKAGNGLLTVTGALAYNGATTINGGTLQLGNGGNTGTINNNAAVTNNGVLAFDRSDDLSFDNLITGTGDVVQTGTNVVTISNAGNSYYGRTVINGGVLSVSFLTNGGAASDIGAASSAASNLVLNGGNLQYTGSGATIDRLFTVGDNGGTLSASGGALNLTNAGALGMTGIVSRTLVLTGPSNGLLAASIANPSSGQTALLKSGSGQWVLSNTNTFSGMTTISGGTLLLAGALAAQSSTVNNLVDGGLTFTNSTSFIVGGLAGSGNIGLTNTDGGSITLSVGSNNSNTTYLGVLSGSGALTKLGSGTLTLSTNQTYLGGTTVSAGTLQLAAGTNTLSTDGAITVAGGVLNLGGASQFSTNSVTISSGSLVNGTLTKSGASYDGQAGTVAAVLAGDVGLTKTTGGTLVLNGTNTYTGATIVSGGTLQVNGQLLTTGLVTVASGATLAGNGGTAGNVTVSSGGILAAGISGVGTLTLTSLNVTNGSLFNYDFSGSANDQLFVTATNGLTLNGGEFRLYQAGTTTPFDSLGTYKLISYDGLIQGSGTNNLLIDPTTQTGNRLYTFGTNGGWVTLTIAGQGSGWLGANSALWADPGNWAGNSVPTNGIAVFLGSSELNTTNNLANAQFVGITFSNGAGAFTLNSAIAGANTVTLQGDVVNLSANTQTINLPLLIAGAQGGTFNASNADIVVAGKITFDSYASGLLKTGPNVLELTGNNIYTQRTTIAGGILRVTSSGLSPNSNLIFTNGVLESRGVMALTRTLGAGAGSIQWAGSGGFSAKGGTLTVNLGGAGGTLVWGTSSFVPNGSTLQFSSSQADSTVSFMNALNLNGGGRTIQVDNGSAFVDVDMTGAISGTSGSGLIKTGAGTLRLSGNSSFSGALTVNAGTLVLAGTLSNTSVFVSSGATVGGTGLFDSALTLASGATLTPGQGGAGLLTVSSLNLSNGFVYDWELGMTATDRVDVTTLNGLNYFGSNQWTLQLGAEPGVAGLAQWQGSGVLTDQFVLFQFNGVAPAGLTNAVTIIGGDGWDASQARVSIVDNQVLLSGVMFNQSFVVIPEPNVLLMWLAGGFTLWAARRRRRQHRHQKHFR